ncbi:MAG: hypothetical protein HRF51_10620 [bacterium]|jgi:hypothetical protein
MPKKILVAERSDTIRGIAEAVLHQNGYDVVSAATLEKAKELIITGQPNLIVLGADLKDAEGKYLYDSLEENPMMASIPLLLIADPDGRSLPYPDEVILPRPFEPNDFIERVRLFAGGGNQKPATSGAAPRDQFTMDTIDDAFLDAALGIEKISVESSEEFDKTFMTGKLKTGAKSDGGDAFNIAQQPIDEQEKKGGTQKVETLMIREDSGAVKEPKKEQEKLSGTSQIEIATDQYGLITQEAPANPDVLKPNVHDYDWFIKEMQKDAANITFTPDGSKVTSTPSEKIMEPIPPTVAEVEHPATNISEEMPAVAVGVEKFIEKFKEEVKQLEGQAEAGSADRGEAPALSESADLGEVRHFSNYVAELLAERLAKEIASKLDAETIFKLVKSDLAKILAAKK